MIDEHKSLSEKFIKKGFWLYIFSFIIWPIWYIIKIIISNEITVWELGILYWIISLVTLLSTYNDLGFTESLKYFVPKFITEKRNDKVKSVIFYALFAQIITSLFIALFFFFGADFIANNYFKSQQAKELLKIFAFFFIWINIFQTINNFFIAVQDTFSHKITEFFRMIFILFSVLFVFFWEYSSLTNYAYSWLIWLYIWILITLYFFYKKYYKRYFSDTKISFDRNLIKSIFKYSAISFLSAQVWVLLSQIDMQMIIVMLDTQKAWYYTNYLSIINIPFIILWPIFAFLFPVFSELYSKWEKEKINFLKNKFINIFLLIWIIFNGFMFIFAENIAFVLFWENYIESWIILRYSILFLIFNFLLQINFNLMAGIWEVKQRAKILTIAIFFNFVLNFILIKFIWVYGAALATWIGWILIWFLTENFLKKEFRSYIEFKEIFKNFVLFIIIWILFYFWVNKIFAWLERINWFFVLFAVWLAWSAIFIIINKKMFKNFVLEIKKLRKR